MTNYLLFLSVIGFFFIGPSLPVNCSAAYKTADGIIKNNPAHSLQQSFITVRDWSFEKLARAFLYAEDIGSSAIIILHDGQLVAEWGQTTLRIKSHSVRKSLLSALYGIAVGKGLIDISTTLAEIGIDDRPPCLTEKEKAATIADLLKARSGVYHGAAAETASMKKKKPARGSYAPGEYWYYNNWDFNVLGTVFERKTNLNIGQAFKQWIAEPIGMQDFRAKDVHYEWESASIHPSYPFWITPRDLARLGQLYLQKGRWKDTKVIPAAWIQESTKSYSETPTGGYGYMWWIRPNGAYYASGHFGQKVLIIPHNKIVIVNSVFSGTPAIYYRFSSEAKKELSHLINPVDNREFRKLVELLLEAAPTGVQ